jgi:carbon-monoxide dehydrogenase small subunit
MSQRRAITLSVNGVVQELTVEPRDLLSDVLRHQLYLTGTRVGCEHGVCGACTVMLDGLPVRSCTALAVSLEGREIVTIEEIVRTPEGEQVATAFRDCHAVQCGFCSPGFVVSLSAALKDGADVDQVLEDVVPGHVCRCTGYVNIRQAVRQAWGVGNR